MQQVQIESFNIIGIAIRTTNENGQAATDIPKLWDAFLSNALLSKIPSKIDGTIYSLYTEYESDHTKPYTTILGCKVEHLDEIPEGMVGKSFKGGKYLKLTANGNLTEGLVANQWYQIWDMDLDRRYTVDFEAYGEKTQNPQEAQVDFFIAIE